MRKLKKLICFTAIFSMLATSNVSAAVNKTDHSVSKNKFKTEVKFKNAKVERKDGYTLTTITDKEDLSRPEILAGAEIPEGYKLVEVVVGVSDTQDQALSTPTQEVSSSEGSQLIKPYGIIPPPIYYYWADNVYHNPIECYFPNSPDYSDWYDGPANVDIAEERGFTSKYSTTTGLDTGKISSTVGFEVGVSYKRTVTYKFTVASNERVNVKVHSNNLETSYNEYRREISTPNSTENLGVRYAYNPIGAIWFQYRYTK